MQTMVTKTLNFSDCAGNIYRVTCQFTLRNGVLCFYDCPAIKNMPNCHVSGGAGNEVFVQPKALDDGSEPDRKPYQKDNIKKFCVTCTMKQNCGR
jgi:hypothetical protein